jgi:iron complex outermembrane receptor protein
MLTGDAHAQQRSSQLSDMAIEDLLNVVVTSASRKEQSARDVAAAVYVITREDIRRSGLTSVPELLRLVPGVHVAQINANRWAVSIRGFSGVYANKLLVLVDGRSIYNRLFAGTEWELPEVLVDDIERIEVIRGPGAVMWGANAVNGVINIVTVASDQVQGLTTRVAATSRAGFSAGLRYGSGAGPMTYRLFTQWSRSGDSVLAENLRSAEDRGDRAVFGGRADWNGKIDEVTLQGNGQVGGDRGRFIDLAPGAVARFSRERSETWSGVIRGRWTRTPSEGRSLRLQAYADARRRLETLGDYHRRAAEIDLQYRTRVGIRHDVVVGGAFRRTTEEFLGGAGVQMTPNRVAESLVSAFAQDEISLADDRVHVTAGLKLERQGSEPLAVQPTIRAMWDLGRRQHVWGGISRAIRRPALNERYIRFSYPPMVVPGSPLPVAASILGNPDLEPEVLVSSEVGYRVQFPKAVSLDVATFAGSYRHLRTHEQLPPQVDFTPGGPVVRATSMFGNLLDATTRGLEVVGHWAPARDWRIDASYARFSYTPTLDASSTDVTTEPDGLFPRQQWSLHTAGVIGTRTQVSGTVFRVGAIDSIAVPAYTRVDARAEYRLGRGVYAAVVGTNLTTRVHSEFSEQGLLATRVPRTFEVGIVLRR